MGQAGTGTPAPRTRSPPGPPAQQQAVVPSNTCFRCAGGGGGCGCAAVVPFFIGFTSLRQFMRRVVHVNSSCLVASCQELRHLRPLLTPHSYSSIYLSLPPPTHSVPPHTPYRKPPLISRQPF